MADEPCRWCGQPRDAAHGGGMLCPFIKAISFHADGVTVARVEFTLPADLGAPAKEEAKPEPAPEPDYPRKKPMREG